jgi:hypothetical protein
LEAEGKAVTIKSIGVTISVFSLSSTTFYLNNAWLVLDVLVLFIAVDYVLTSREMAIAEQSHFRRDNRVHTTNAVLQ